MEEGRVHNSLVMDSEYEFCKFREVLKESKEYLLKLDSEKRLVIIRELLKNPNFDDTDVYYLAMIEIQQDPSYKPPFVEPQKPPPCKIRFVMRGRQPAEPIREEEKAARRTDGTGRKRSRCSSDCEFDEEEETVREMKKSANKKKVNNVGSCLPEKRPDLPAAFKERIQNLGGTEASLVIQKDLTATDVSSGHGRLSLPWTLIEDKEFLSGEEKEFLDKRRKGDGVPEIEARVIGENGKESEVGIRLWNKIRNLVKGWNGVVIDHGLSERRIVQLWSFRVEGKLRFALVKLGFLKKEKRKTRNILTS